MNSDGFSEEDAILLLSSWAEVRRRTLRNEPPVLSSARRDEEGVSRDYQGREILELLQNGADAAAANKEIGKIRVELSHSGLLVANTGRPFSPEGIESLRLPHYSPKLGGVSLIGSKGLGFRAVLNWTDEPIILSGSWRIGWSHRLAMTEQQSLALSDERLSQEISAEQKRSGSDRIVPLLAFPGWLRPETRQDWLSDCQFELANRAEALRQEYSTVVGMPFTRPGAFENARAQLAELKHELLLFTSALGELTIVDRENTNLTETNWKVIRRDISATILKDGATVDEWQVFRDSGNLPGTDREFEVVVAVSTRPTVSAQSLFCFFPTDVHFPYPVVAHATLELQENRKHIRATDTNRFVLARLAELLVKASEAVTRPDDTWAGARVIAQMAPLPNEVLSLDFDSHLVAAAIKRPLLPSLSDKRIAAAHSFSIRGADKHWLPMPTFSDVIAAPTEQRLLALLNHLRVPDLTASEMAIRFRSCPLLDLNQRAAVICGIISNRAIPFELMPDLLIDESGAVIPKGTKAFLPPEGPPIGGLPTWIQLRFINPQLCDALKTGFQVERVRFLRERLSHFGVQEYSLSPIIEEVIRAGRDRAAGSERGPEEVITALRVLYDRALLDGVMLPEKARPLLKSMSGDWRPANKLLLSKNYGPEGQLMEALFRTTAPENLVSAPAEVGLEESDPSRVRFLTWLGVATKPRETVCDSVPVAYVKHCQAFIPKVVSFDNGEFETARIGLPDLRNVVTVEGLVAILRADASAILGWLATDSRWGQWAFPSVRHCAAIFTPKKAEKAFSGPLPSFVRWMLQSSVWLPTEDGGSSRPETCLIDGSTDSVLPTPRLLTSQLFDTLEVSEQRLREAWSRAGVNSRLRDVSPHVIYEALIRLPEIDSSGDRSHEFYRQLLASYDPLKIDMADSHRLSFIKQGRLWGAIDGKTQYLPAKDLRYGAVDSIGPLLSRLIPLIDLPVRRDSVGIERLFGARPLRDADYRRRILSESPSDFAASFLAEFQIARPLLKALRRRQTDDQSDIRKLESLVIRLCVAVEMDVEYEGRTTRIALQPYQWNYDSQTGVARIVITNERPGRLSQDPLLANVVAAVLGATFNIRETAEYAQLLQAMPDFREHLLAQMLGENLANTQQLIASAPTERPPVLFVPQPQIQSEPNGAPAPSNNPEVPPPVTSERTSEPAPLNGRFEIVKEHHEPSEPRQKVHIRVHGKNDTDLPSEREPRQLVDPERYEKIAARFEELHGRFPVGVGHIRGYGGPRCDVLSFATSEDRDAFQTGVRSDYAAAAVRLIEVKGTSTDEWLVTLKGNELDAAREHREIYFLYRISEQQNLPIKIRVLGNPLADPDGVEDASEINLAQAKRTEQYRMTALDIQPLVE